MRPVVKLAPGTYHCKDGSTIQIDNDYPDDMKDNFENPTFVFERIMN